MIYGNEDNGCYIHRMKKFFFIFILPLQLVGQNTLADFKKYPFPTELVGSKKGNKIAFALDEQGKRNVYVAEGPSYIARKLTNYNLDDGQEITSLTISDDGHWIVFVRGGDHGANWESGLPLNPTGDAKPFTVKIASIPFNGGEVKYLSEGDYPVIHPDSKSITFIKGGQAWTSSIDSANAKNLFTTRGTVGDLEWNAAGTSLLFNSDRGDHSINGIFTNSMVKWVAPSFTRDESPHWSPDGNKIVFIRRPGVGGTPDSMLRRYHNPWSIYTADIHSDKATLLWKAPTTLRGSVPTTHGGYNLHWAANDRIVFLSYHDGWPHLYSIPSSGGKETLLTPGNFMCEHISLSPDGKYLSFSANTGPEKLDLERRHAAIVSVDKADLKVITPGTGNEWAPVMLENGNAIACIASNVHDSPLPAIIKISDQSKTMIGEELKPDDFPKDKMITPKQVIFTSSDGVTVHADLFVQEGGAARKPAIVYIHGGPPRQMLLGWHYSDYYSNAFASNQYLANQGFVVLAVNYRLGIGYGYEFHQAHRAGMNGASEYLDIKAGGEWLARQSFVDASKIGVYGGSYGGFLTAMALAKDSKLFAAGVDIHGVHDWGISRNIMNAFNGKTEKAPDYDLAIRTAWLSSPVAYVNTWKSPVLFIHADDDRNVRFNQTTDLIQRLDKKGVPYETMMIVDDSHHWMKWDNAVKVYSAVGDYFMRKLK